jgi:hypothetical protein
MMALKPRMVSLSATYLPGLPVKTSATWNGCDRKRWILRARLEHRLHALHVIDKQYIVYR